MSQTTFKNIIESFQTIANAHYQVNDFNWGDIHNISSTGDHEYVLIWLHPTTLSTTPHTIVYTFEMFILDLLLKDNANLIDVISNTQQIGNDIVTELYDNRSCYNFDVDKSDIEAEIVYEEYDDIVAGWRYTIKINVNNIQDECHTAFDNSKLPC